MPTKTWRTTLASATADVARRHLDMPVVAISPASMADDEARIYREAVYRSSLDARCLTVLAALHRRFAPAPMRRLLRPTGRARPRRGHSLSEIDSKRLLRPFASGSDRDSGQHR